MQKKKCHSNRIFYKDLYEEIVNSGLFYFFIGVQKKGESYEKSKKLVSSVFKRIGLLPHHNFTRVNWYSADFDSM